MKKEFTDLTAEFQASARDLYREIEGMVAAYAHGEAQYEALSAKLIELESRQQSAFKGSGRSDDLERAFAVAVGLPKKQARSLNDYLIRANDSAMGNQGLSFFDRPWATQAVVQDVVGEIVPPDARQGGLRPSETGAHPYHETHLPRTEGLITAMIAAGIFADDLLIWRGQDRPGRLRGAGYTVIGIPRLGRQVAISDRVGEACFISTQSRPLEFWTTTDKAGLMQTQGIARIVCTEGWVDQVINHVKAWVGDIAQTPKVALPQRSKAPLLDPTTIKRWARAKLARDRQWPVQASTEPPIDFDGCGGYVEVGGEKWRNIMVASSHGDRGLESRPLGDIFSGLYQEMKDEGFDVPKPVVRNNSSLNVADIKRWARAKLARDRQWPVQDSIEAPIDFDGLGGYVEVEGEVWGNITLTCSRGRRGLEPRPLGAIFLELYQEMKAKGLDVPKPNTQTRLKEPKAAARPAGPR